MRIGIRAHDMEKAPLEELVKNIKDKGFYSTQLALQKAIHDFNTSPEAMTPGMAFYVREIFSRYKVDIAVLGCYLNLANPVEEERKQILGTYKTHIRFAGLLGCGMVGTETGAVNREYTFEPANHSEKALEVLIENLKTIVEYAEKMGVIVGMEPVYKHIVSDIERANRVLNAVNSPNLQIILDPVNLLNYDNYKEQDDIIKGAFQLFGRDIAAIHIKDFQVGNKKIAEIPAGNTGLFHYETLLTLIKSRKPFIHVLLEGTSPSNAIIARKHLEDIYQNISSGE